MRNSINNKLNVFTLPNLLSFIRLLTAFPLYIFLSDLETGANRYYVLIFIFIGFLTDMLDGYIARKYDKISEFGKIIDPLADKVAILVIILQLYRHDYIVPLYFWTVILRDLLIFTGGIIVSQIIKKVLPSNLLGKITAFSIGLYLLLVIIGLEITLLYKIVFYISLLLCYLSLIGYAVRAYESIKWYKRNEAV
ncbi:CDP-alcohol phosphatidyltransferase family protein [Melioribacter roseus]|uniref:CDP-alcohol phosphatidyltransferase family protein n=1 Tax=Melioribacter roseus TaxID=1134405 RepID=UPI00059BD107|nr:CDP-alcohol phosphatidyltransferase family protein [Melioribacter roseus]